jgi:uncharacterized membrane protein HdeD (DUF308 family)
MRAAVSSRSTQPIARERRGFTLRGRPAQAFASLAVFAAGLFLGGGVYLIFHALLNPMEAEAVWVITGACGIALGAILLFHLWARPRRSASRSSSL